MSSLGRREDFRVWWAEHLKAHRDSGQSQANYYCRARSLHQKYFTLWKRKLREERSPAKTTESPRLAAVTVRPDRLRLAPDLSQSEAPAAPAAVVAIRLNLCNGISVSLEVATGSIPTLVRELASVRC